MSLLQTHCQPDHDGDHDDHDGVGDSDECDSDDRDGDDCDGDYSSNYHDVYDVFYCQYLICSMFNSV